MHADTSLVSRLIAACRQVIEDHADRLCSLDQAIGDGDHGTNMVRGMNALSLSVPALSELPLPQACEEIGRVLVSHVGGASGPLYGTLFIELGRQMQADGNPAACRQAFGKAVEAVARRGRAQAGDKTLLDVLLAIQTQWAERCDADLIGQSALRAARLTAPMQAMRGRASWLGERSIGHVDPGAESCALMAQAICAQLSGDAA